MSTVVVSLDPSAPNPSKSSAMKTLIQSLLVLQHFQYKLKRLQKKEKGTLVPLNLQLKEISKFECFSD